MKKIIAGLTLAAMVAAGFASAIPQAYAASSLNGFYHSNGKSGNSWKHSSSYYTTSQQVTIEAYIRQIEALLAQLRMLQSGNNYNQGGFGNSEVSVTTKSADDIEDDAATLRGVVDFNNSDEATVYFRWGISSSNLNQETPQIVLDDTDDEAFDAYIDDLNEDRTYYYRAVAEDEDGRRVQGAVMSFRTDDDSRYDDDDDKDNDEDWPEVETGDADTIQEDYAVLAGEVDMNDYENGYVFVAYGEDEDLVSLIADEYNTYQSIDEEGDDLRTQPVDSALDDRREYRFGVSGLDEDTEIFYAYCVAFEDNDDDDRIVCGDTESFTTDED